MLTIAPATSVQRSLFGTLPDGRKVEAVTLTNASGMTARVIAWGAILQELCVPDRHGHCTDVVLGYADLAGYLAEPNYFGATIGRYANRISGGRFTLDGHEYALARNDGPNALHGGIAGFDKRLWTITAVESGPVASVVLSYTSPAGEEGYPGALEVTVKYSLDAANQLTIELGATTNAPTIVSLTHHSYFNLASAASALDQVLTIPAEHYTPVDAALIPTGELRPVAGTNFDFRQPTPIGARIGDRDDQQLAYGNGYDHNWVIARSVSHTPRLNARLSDPASGRTMELWSNQPGLQFYSGNFLCGTVIGKAGRAYQRGDGLCLEPQLFPDTPNQPAFGSARLDPGQRSCNRIELRFSASQS